MWLILSSYLSYRRPYSKYTMECWATCRYSTKEDAVDLEVAAANRLRCVVPCASMEYERLLVRTK